MNGSNTTPSALETGAGSHSTTRRKSSRKRNLPAEITTPPPAPSPDAPAEASSSSNSKVTAEDYREVACLFIALKVKLSKRKIERLMHCPGICGGTRIEHHIAQSRKAKKQMDASVWKTLVDNAWTKWKDTFEPPLAPLLASLIQPTAEDLKLPAPQRKRKAAQAAVADLVNDQSLDVAWVTSAAATRFKLDSLNKSTVYRFKKNFLGTLQYLER